MPFKKMMQVGRVCYGTKGPLKRKIFVVVNIIDYNRALVDGPCSGVSRQEYRFMDLRCTPFTIKVTQGYKTKFIREAWKEAKIDQKFAKSAIAKNAEIVAKRSKLNDFDRWNIVRLKRAKARFITNRINIVKKCASKGRKLTHKKVPISFRGVIQPNKAKLKAKRAKKLEERKAQSLARQEKKKSGDTKPAAAKPVA